MRTMAGTAEVKTQDTEIKLDKLKEYVSMLVADKIILITGLHDIKDVLVSKTDIKINILLEKINHALEAVDHRDELNGRHSKKQ